VEDDEFEQVARGWMMSVDEAREVGMPVTHGCRLSSNNPCVRFLACLPYLTDDNFRKTSLPLEHLLDPAPNHGTSGAFMTDMPEITHLITCNGP
jgi:hypothetical protein